MLGQLCFEVRMPHRCQLPHLILLFVEEKNSLCPDRPLPQPRAARSPFHHRKVTLR